MSTRFVVNGIPVVADHDSRLIRYLRDDLHLTSVKDGCSEGACGTCTILVDGKAVKACTLMVSEMEGKAVTTVEGLSQREKDIFTYAFGEAGAVQCGFCIPGMVICSKALLDENQDPTDKEIRHALRNNICRCTGYAKIVKAVELAAKLFRQNKEEHSPNADDISEQDALDTRDSLDTKGTSNADGTIPHAGSDANGGSAEQEADLRHDTNWRIGQRVPRVDVLDKVTGKGIYPDDIYADGMLHVVAVRSKHPRARVLAIDTSIAIEANGVCGIFTAEDIPGEIKVGHILKDWDAMVPIGGITKYLGDVICIVVGETNDDARKAADLVKVQYEVLPFVSSPYEAMKEDAPLVHEGREGGNLLGHTHVDRGDADEALAHSRYVLHEKYSTPWTEHAFLEPEAAVAFPLGDGGVKIYSTDQSVYDTRRETAPMLGLPPEKVIVENCYIGGGFGGKEDVTVQHLSALAAILTGRPCKMKLTRQESILVHPKRHPMDMDFTLGCNEDGIIQGLKATVIADTGAYASLGLPVLQRACTHASGPYNYENFRIDGYAYYTNNPPAGAFRGFGVTQTCFAIESMLNHIADEIGISHWEIRHRNAIRPGQSLPNGQIVDNATGLVETLEAVKDEYESNRHAGIACAMKNAGVGVGLLDFGRVDLEVKGGRVLIHCGGSCIGQGLFTILKQIVCDITGLSSDVVAEEKPNTLKAPDSGTTSGSRHTTVTGEAARRAAVALKEALDDARQSISGKADALGQPDSTKTHRCEGSIDDVLKALEGREFYAEYLAETDPFGSDKPHPKSHVAYGYATQVAILDEKTHKIDRIIAAHDVGRAINPTNVEGQIEGGVIMGTGYALREDYPLKDCRPLAKYGSLGLFRADEVPDIVPVIVEKPGLDIANGGKGLGEITSIPTAPCIADAYYRLDGIKRFSLPIENTPYSPNADSDIHRKAKSLAVNKNARCIGCLECMRTCSKIFFKQEKASLAFLQVRERKGVGNQSGIQGMITRPVTCIQCGRCADACPQGAISRNQFGVCVVDLKMCNNCGKCRDACPFGLMVEDPVMHVSKKCIACGQCAKACPMGVLEIATPETLP